MENENQGVKNETAKKGNDRAENQSVDNTEEQSPRQEAMGVEQISVGENEAETNQPISEKEKQDSQVGNIHDQEYIDALNANSNALFYEKEREHLINLTFFLQQMKPFVYDKVKRTGDLCVDIGNEMGVEDTEFYLAGYYANLGIVSFDTLDSQDAILNNDSNEVIKRHPKLIVEYLYRRNLNKAADYVKNHHELPSGAGYYKQTSYPKYSAYINIADIYTAMTTLCVNRPRYKIAEIFEFIDLCYKNQILIKSNEMNIIKNILLKNYNEKGF